MRGACVNTDTCSCPYGYDGNRCQNISKQVYALPTLLFTLLFIYLFIYCVVTFECGPDNPCQNNGSCYLQTYTYYCTCEVPYTGTYCETG